MLRGRNRGFAIRSGQQQSAFVGFDLNLVDGGGRRPGGNQRFHLLGPHGLRQRGLAQRFAHEVVIALQVDNWVVHKTSLQSSVRSPESNIFG